MILVSIRLDHLLVLARCDIIHRHFENKGHFQMLTYGQAGFHPVFRFKNDSTLESKFRRFFINYDTVCALPLTTCRIDKETYAIRPLSIV